jgi:hypothetical protein
MTDLDCYGEVSSNHTTLKSALKRKQRPQDFIPRIKVNYTLRKTQSDGFLVEHKNPLERPVVRDIDNSSPNPLTPRDIVKDFFGAESPTSQTLLDIGQQKHIRFTITGKIYQPEKEDIHNHSPTDSDIDTFFSLGSLSSPKISSDIDLTFQDSPVNITPTQSCQILVDYNSSSLHQSSTTTSTSTSNSSTYSNSKTYISTPPPQDKQQICKVSSSSARVIGKCQFIIDMEENVAYQNEKESMEPFDYEEPFTDEEYDPDDETYVRPERIDDDGIYGAVDYVTDKILNTIDITVLIYRGLKNLSFWSW